MAATLRPQDAFDLNKSMIKNMPLEDVKVRILDSINKRIWMAAPWRWSVTMTTSPVSVTSNTQDYTLAQPSDFLFIESAFLEITESSGGNPTRRDLEPVPVLPQSNLRGQPSSIAWNGSTIRLFPAFGTIPASQTVRLFIRYKKTAPTITAANCTTAGVLVMDDEWFPVYEAGVLWMAYLYGDDQRAGSISFQNGQTQASGQAALFFSGIEEMRQREPLPLEDARSAPELKKSK